MALYSRSKYKPFGRVFEDAGIGCNGVDTNGNVGFASAELLPPEKISFSSSIVFFGEEPLVAVVAGFGCDEIKQELALFADFFLIS